MKVLRKYNISLLQKLFSLEFGVQSTNESDFQNYLNKIIFMNQEFLKKYVIILEEKLNQTLFQRISKEKEISQMKTQMEKLEKVIIFLKKSNKTFYNFFFKRN